MPGDYKGRRELKTCLIGVSSHPLMWLKNIPATCERLRGCSYIICGYSLQFIVVVVGVEAAIGDDDMVVYADIHQSGSLDDAAR